MIGMIVVGIVVVCVGEDHRKVEVVLRRLATHLAVGVELLHYGYGAEDAAAVGDELLALGCVGRSSKSEHYGVLHLAGAERAACGGRLVTCGQG